MARISIVLAVYNGEADVERCVNSLRNQSFEDIEIICVDDGSTDGTVDVLKRLAAEDSRIKVFEQDENKKLLLAIKRGVKEATGEYIMFVDDDDWYEANACERVIEVVERDHPDIVYYGANLVEPDGNSNSSIKDNRAQLLKSLDLKYRGENTLDIEGLQYTYLWNKAVKADVAKMAYAAMPDVEMTYHSDMYACMMIHYYAKSLISIGDKLLNYNYTNGISANMSMTAEKFDYLMRCSRIYEDGVSAFLEEKRALHELKSFQKGKKARIMSYICTWRDKLADDESAAAFKSLIEHYDAEIVIPLLKHNYYQVNVDRKIYISRLEK